MELEFVFIGAGALIFIAFLCAVTALTQLAWVNRRLDSLERKVRELIERVGAVTEPSPEAEPPPEAESPPEPTPSAARPAPPAPEPVSPEPEPAGAGESPPSGEASPEPVRSRPAPFADRLWWRRLEEAAGRNWIAWAGVSALFVAVALFVKYAFDQGWLGPWVKVACGAAFGLLLILAGEISIRRRWRPFGLSLLGGGMAVLYATFFAGYRFYGFFSPTVSFLLMVLVTAGGMYEALRHDARSVSFFSALGGFLSPVLVSTGKDPRDALFTYLLVLDIGILTVVRLKRWRFLDIVGMLGTWILYTGWRVAFYGEEALVPALLWAGAFYAVFLIPFLFDVLDKAAVKIERMAGVLAVTAWAFANAWGILSPEHEVLCGAIALFLGAISLSLGIAASRRCEVDGGALLLLSLYATAFLTISAPLFFDGRTVTVLWASEAPFLVALAYLLRYRPIRTAALAPLVLSAFRVAGLHWPLHTETFTPFLNGAFATAATTVLGGWFLSVTHFPAGRKATDMDRTSGRAVALSVGVWGLFLANAELWLYLKLTDREADLLWSSCLLWTVGSALYLAAGTILRSWASRITALLPAATAVGFSALDYIFYWSAPAPIFLSGRFLTGILLGTVLASGCVLYRGKIVSSSEGERRILPAVAAGLISYLLFLFTAEIWFWCDAHDRILWARGILPAVWAAGGLAYVVSGRRLDAPVLKWLGLVADLAAVVFCLAALPVLRPRSWWIFLNPRFLGGAGLAAASYIQGRVFRSGGAAAGDRRSGQALYVLVVWGSWLLLSTEIFSYMKLAFEETRYARWAAHASLTVVWAFYAVVLLGVGFRFRTAWVRLSGLAVFALAGLKLVVVDLEAVDKLYRIAAFFAVGLLMVAASFLYHRLSKIIDQEP